MQLKFCIFSLYSLRVGLSIEPEITREQILGGGLHPQHTPVGSIDKN
jgi:hypothetical protein